MQERRVTISGQTYDLPSPFFVIATQNPIEQEGTYPLPEAQLDRFMFSVKVGYPNAEEEERIIMETTQDASQSVDRVLASDALLNFQHLVRKTPVSKHVGAYATRLVRATRPDAPDAPDFIKNWVRWGAGLAPGNTSSSPRNPTRCCKAGSTFPATTSAPTSFLSAPPRPLQFCRGQRRRRFGRNRAPPRRRRARTRLRQVKGRTKFPNFPNEPNGEDEVLEWEHELGLLR